MPKQITQAELRAVLDHYNRALDKAADIRGRLLEGASIESGPNTVVDDGEVDGAQPFAPTACLSICGLDFRPDTVPDWVNEEIPECEYQLATRLPDGLQEPCLLMTKTEFAELRLLLAKMRGYAVPEVVTCQAR
jgi:hypothetical protein